MYLNITIFNVDDMFFTMIMVNLKNQDADIPDNTEKRSCYF